LTVNDRGHRRFAAPSGTQRARLLTHSLRWSRGRFGDPRPGHHWPPAVAAVLVVAGAGVVLGAGAGLVVDGTGAGLVVLGAGAGVRVLGAGAGLLRAGAGVLAAVAVPGAGSVTGCRAGLMIGGCGVTTAEANGVGRRDGVTGRTGPAPRSIRGWFPTARLCRWLRAQIIWFDLSALAGLATCVLRPGQEVPGCSPAAGVCARVDARRLM
jgi:hypothetical protein